MIRVLVLLSVLLAALLAAIAFLLWGAGSSVDVPFEIAKGLINLAVAIAVTGILTLVLNQRNQERARRDERTKTLTNALQELKSVYEEVQQLRFYLGTNPSAKTFVDQIPAIGRARTRLQRVQRERYVLRTPVEDLAQKMLDYLSDLGEEYRDNYPKVLRGALLEEAALEKVRSGQATELDVAHLPPSEYPKVYSLVDHNEWRSGAFHTSYREARNILQGSLGQP